MVSLIFLCSPSRRALIEYHKTLWCSPLDRTISWGFFSFKPIQRLQCLDQHKVVNIHHVNLACDLLVLQLTLDTSSPKPLQALCACVSFFHGFLFIGQHMCDTPKALRAIKNSVARWCFLNQFCVMLQMHFV